MKSIKKFNPYLMDENLIIKLNTGRENDFNFVMDIIKKNIKPKESIQHVLLIGPRGIGKSFFLKYLGIELKKNEISDYVLLPEEQNNIFNPSELIREIKTQLSGKTKDEMIANWFSEDNELWTAETKKLEKLILKRGKHLVVGIENFDQLFEKGGAFEDKENQFMFRKYFTENENITLIATTLCPDLDNRYDDALFHFFAKHQLSSWKEEEHKSYFEKRNSLENNIKDKKQLDFSSAKLKAITSFTGGSPRITVLISDILIDNNLDSATQNLESLMDELTPFYQDLLSRIPPKSRLLFDALIRGGEPCTQSEVAERVGAKQNQTSQSFNWLINNNYLNMELSEGSKEKLYFVKDRLFDNFYRMRYINHGSGKSILASMSEFLTSFYNEEELRNKAKDFYSKGFLRKSLDILQIINKNSEIDFETFEKLNDLDFEQLLNSEQNNDIESKDALNEIFKAFGLIQIVNSLKKQDLEKGILISKSRDIIIEEALSCFNKAYELITKNNYSEIQIKYDKQDSNETYEIAKNINDFEMQVFSLGLISLYNILLGEEKEAWKLIDKKLDELKGRTYELLDFISDFTYYFEKNDKKSKAYAEGYIFLENIHKRKNIFEPGKSLQIFFKSNLINKVSLSLIEDLYFAAIEIFGKEFEPDLAGIRGILNYLKSGKEQNVLVRMEPEIRKTVETLVNEWNL